MDNLPEFNDDTLLNIYMKRIREHITIYIQSNIYLFETNKI